MSSDEAKYKTTQNKKEVFAFRSLAKFKNLAVPALNKSKRNYKLGWFLLEFIWSQLGDHTFETYQQEELWYQVHL